MKVTDFLPRVAPMDAYLQGTGLTGAEVGVDAGAHAQALLDTGKIKKLYLVDIWDNPFPHAYMLGRLETRGYKDAILSMAMKSVTAANKFSPSDFCNNPVLDFIYFDCAQEHESVKADLELWWPSLKVGGIIGYRNYKIETVRKACDEFIQKHGLKFKVEYNEVIIFK